MHAAVDNDERRRRRWRRWTFAAEYPIPAVRDALVRELAAWGLDRSLPRDPRAVLQYAPFSRLDWRRFEQRQVVVSSQPLHGCLVRKHRLMRRLREAGAAELCGRSATIVAPTRAAARRAAVEHARTLGGAWALKDSDTNNALGVEFVCAEETACPPDDDAPCAPGAAPRTYLVQECPRDVALIRGCKWHLRVNVACVGRCAAYVHRLAVAHVACEPFVPSDWANRFRHITNHTVQRGHPAYAPELHTMEVPDVAAELGRDWCEVLWRSVLSAVRTTFAACVSGRQPAPLSAEKVAVGAAGAARATEPNPAFTPLADCFEVLGFDFLPLRDGRVLLLEVNEGPALEGMCKPLLAARVVADVCHLICVPLCQVFGSPEEFVAQGVACPSDAHPLVWDASANVAQRAATESESDSDS